jgi:hypothetical protein
MSQEDEELLKAVREWRPSTTLHPIAVLAWTLYEKNEMSFPQSAVDELRSVLDSYGDDIAGLAAGIEGAVRFMLLLDQRGDQESSKAVLTLLRSYAELFEPFWQRVAEALQNVGGDTKEAFEKFSGEADPKLAAVIDQPPPPGTVPLAKLTSAVGAEEGREVRRAPCCRASRRPRS